MPSRLNNFDQRKEDLVVTCKNGTAKCCLLTRIWQHDLGGSLFVFVSLCYLSITVLALFLRIMAYTLCVCQTRFWLALNNPEKRLLWAQAFNIKMESLQTQPIRRVYMEVYILQLKNLQIHRGDVARFALPLWLWCHILWRTFYFNIYVLLILIHVFRTNQHSGIISYVTINKETVLHFSKTNQVFSDLKLMTYSCLKDKQALLCITEYIQLVQFHQISKIIQITYNFYRLPRLTLISAADL